MTLHLDKNARIRASHPSALHGLTIHEAILMAETRKRLLHALRTASVSDDLRAAARSALRSRHRLHAPFLPLSPVQRLAWLDETDRITCIAPLSSFRPGQEYPLTTGTLAFRKIETRPAPTMPGGTEQILITRHDLVASIRAISGRWHSFCVGSPPTDQLPNPLASIHPITTLIKHFEIPEVPDLAKLFPARFKALKEKFASI